MRQKSIESSRYFIDQKLLNYCINTLNDKLISFSLLNNNENKFSKIKSKFEFE